MSPAQSFRFMRHGATEPNLRGERCGGDRDVGLAPLGRSQSAAGAARLRATGVRVGVIVASNLARTRETAAIVSDALGGVPIVIEPRFDERRLGDWNGCPIVATQPAISRGETPPGGEPQTEFRARVGAGFARVHPLIADGLLIVSSSGVGRVLHSLLGGTGRLALPNGAIARFIVPAAPVPHDTSIEATLP